MKETCSQPGRAFAWRSILLMLAMALWSLAASGEFAPTPTYQGRSGWCSDGQGGPLTQPSTSGQAVCNELASIVGRCIDVRATGQFVFEAGVKGPYCDLDLPYNPASGGGGGPWRAAPPTYLLITSSCPANSQRVGQACACLPGYAEQATPGGIQCRDSLRISLSGPGSTRAMPAGPALPFTAVVLRAGQPEAGQAVSVRLASGGTLGGTTDAAGRFEFTFTPGHGAAGLEALDASCTQCANTATASIAVEPAAPPACEGEQGNPIQPATGEKVQREADWQDASPHPLHWRRTYRSLTPASAGLDTRWTHHWHGTLVLAAGGNLATVGLGDGTSVIFTRAGAASPWRADNGRDRLQPSIQGLDYLRGDDDSTWHFDGAGGLTGVTERNGWHMRLARDDLGRLASLTNAFGRRLALDWVGPQLAGVTLPDGTRIDYGYDRSGRLAQVRHADGTLRSYLYEDARWPRALTGITDEARVPSASYRYDDQGRAIASAQADGVGSVEVGYPALPSRASLSRGLPPAHAGSGSPAYSVRLVDALGVAREQAWSSVDGQLRLAGTSAPQPGQALASRSVGPLGLPLSETDFNGVATTYAYDMSRLLPVAVTQAQGLAEERTTRTEWHPQWRLPLRVEEPGRAMQWTYDAQGNPASATLTDTATGRARNWSWRHDARGLLEASTVPGGATWRHEHDDAGNRVRTVDPTGAATRWTP